MTSPIDIVANAIRTADGSHTMGAGQLAEVAAAALTSNDIVANAANALREHGWQDETEWTAEDVARLILGSVGGASAGDAS